MDKFNGLDFAQKSKIVSESWAQLTEQQRVEYQVLANKEKERYQDEIKQLGEKGYFINKDGKDSRDLYKAPKSQGGAATPTLAPKPPTFAKVKQSPAPVVEDLVVMPKKASNVFMFFCTEQSKIIRDQDPNMQGCKEISKIVGEKWAKLTDEEKTPYVKKRDEAQVRYETEMKQLKELGYFINSNGVKSTDLTPKKKKIKRGTGQVEEMTTVKPKKVALPYCLFLKEWHQTHKGQTEGKAAGEVSKIIAKEWNSMTPEAKKKYEDMRDEDKERHEVQMEEMKLKGFFIMDDGSKSSDHQKKVKNIKR